MSKDSAEVVAFLAGFAELRRACCDKPEKLAALTETDTHLTHLCKKVHLAANDLRQAEQRSPALFAAPVNSGFLATWREYQARYEAFVFGITLRHSEGEIVYGPLDVFGEQAKWTGVDANAAHWALGIEAVMMFARMAAKFPEHAEQAYAFVNDTGDDEDSSDHIQNGLDAWEYLKEIGFDVRGLLRRRWLTPFVLVNREIAAKHGSIEKLSMLRNLQDAQNAFAYGAMYAALALMRSVMETVLCDHYAAEGKDLSDRIRSVRSRLPPGANEASLHRLRKLANKVLHLGGKKDVGLPWMDEAKLEKEIVSLLLVLRTLIEGVKR
jgi:hypothetical protein